MTKPRAFALFAVLLALLLSAPAVSAQEEPVDAPESDPQEENTDSPPGEAPVVPVELADESLDESEAWTFRYLVPTLLALTGLVVVAVLIGYFVRVRSRYVVRQ